LEERLFREGVPWARGIAVSVYRRLPPSFDRDDLIQVALIELWKRARMWREDSGVPFQGYAHVYVRSAVLMSVRRREYTERTHCELKVDPAGGKRPEVQVEAVESVARLHEALGKLGRVERYVVERHDMEGVSLARLSELMGRSVATLGGIRCRALERLHQELRGRVEGVSLARLYQELREHDVEGVSLARLSERLHQELRGRVEVEA